MSVTTNINWSFDLTDVAPLPRVGWPSFNVWNDGEPPDEVILEQLGHNLLKEYGV